MAGGRANRVTKFGRLGTLLALDVGIEALGYDVDLDLHRRWTMLGRQLCRQWENPRDQASRVNPFVCAEPTKDAIAATFSRSCLTQMRSRFKHKGETWCRRADSNRRPRAYETRALTG
jgi:hypothetical protein